jgi:hypothetical protein
METYRKYSGMPEKLGHLMKDLRHKIAKKYGICVITSTQESRGGQLLKKAKKERGVESIGESNKIAPHCHIIILLDNYVKKDDVELKNKLRMYCFKNTLGPEHWSEDVWFLKEFQYIGDSNFGLIKVQPKKKKEEKEKVTDKEEDKDFAFENI